MSDRLVTVATFWSIAEADVARCYLESEGIRAYLADDHVLGSLWQYSNAVGGVKVQVGDGDAADAIELLTANRAAEADAEGAATQQLEPSEDAWSAEPLEQLHEHNADEDTYEDEPNAREANVDRALRGAVLGVMFFPLQPFVFRLLIKVFLSDDGLRPSKRRRAVYAAIINIPFMLAILWFVGLIVRDWIR